MWPWRRQRLFPEIDPVAEGKRIFWWVLGVTLAAVGLAVMLPGGPPPESPRFLPWQIEVLPDGRSRVFGIRLGESPLGELEQKLQQEAEISLFASDGGSKSVEAYFNSVTLSGLKARMVAVLGLDEATLQQMFDRGERIATYAQGQRKVTLSDADLALARRSPVVAITYLPRTDLDEATITRLFGTPARTIAEPGGRIVHWLYPDKGLDVAMDRQGKEVFQYVPPRDFERLTKPLEGTTGQP